MRFSDLTIYHLFTMGFCGAETYHDECESIEHRLLKILEILPYLKRLGINTLLLGPLCASESHGYDTTDYFVVDKRLGTNEDLVTVIEKCHQMGFRVVLDGVFNHTGRAFFAFKDVQEKREQSAYKEWFQTIDFDGNNQYNDGFSYANWAGCDNLVKLNLQHPEVKTYLNTVIEFWIDQFDIDGLRIDAANVMNLDFLKEISQFSKSKKKDFLLIGEAVQGDYNGLVHQGALDSVTNYEDYKGLYSSLNDKNYFEIAYSFNRLFGKEQGLYQDFYTYNFVDNHDVNRIASTLNNKSCLKIIYLMLFTMPGMPSIYYGSELAIEGVKGDGTDAPLRPAYEDLNFDEGHSLYKAISKMISIRKKLALLRYGQYSEMFVQSQQFGYIRTFEGQEGLILFNSDEQDCAIVHEKLVGTFYDCYQNDTLNLHRSVVIPACSGRILVDLNFWESLSDSEAQGRKEEKPQKPTLQDFMKQALAEAKKGFAEGEVPIGAIIVKDHKIIAANHNRKEGLKDPTAHAEMLVIREAAQKLNRWRLEDCELYVTAEPCPMCMGAMIQSRIKKLVYGVAEKKFGAVESTAFLGQHPMLFKNFEIYPGICEEECQELLKQFFSNKR